MIMDVVASLKIICNIIHGQIDYILDGYKNGFI